MPLILRSIAVATAITTTIGITYVTNAAMNQQFSSGFRDGVVNVPGVLETRHGPFYYRASESVSVPPRALVRVYYRSYVFPRNVVYKVELHENR